MNCNTPIIALRLPGLSPGTGKAHKPYYFHRFVNDDDFIRTYFDFKSRIPEVPLKYVDLFSPDRDAMIPAPEVLILPCGKCSLCVRQYKRNWACRCICEAQTSNGGQFLTLTCSDYSQLRTFPGNNLIHRPFQLFLKRLRHPSNQDDLIWLSDNHKIRYYMCGEYGSISHRAHYHAILFGVDFRGKYPVGVSKSGHTLYSAPVIDRCRYVAGEEVFGPVSNFSACSPADICYTVGYVDKKLLGERERVLLNDDNKMYREHPPYTKMSRRPGIGYNWVKLYHGDVWRFANDELLTDSVEALPGLRYFPPRYFFDSAAIGNSSAAPLISEREKSIILQSRRDRAAETVSSPAALREALARTHAKCEIYTQQQRRRALREGFTR